MDAWWSDGWWEGVITGVEISGPDTVQVYYPGKFYYFAISDAFLEIILVIPQWAALVF